MHAESMTQHGTSFTPYATQIEVKHTRSEDRIKKMALASE
jgi:hypothetical protein